MGAAQHSAATKRCLNRAFTTFLRSAQMYTRMLLCLCVSVVCICMAVRYACLFVLGKCMSYPLVEWQAASFAAWCSRCRVGTLYQRAAISGLALLALRTGPPASTRMPCTTPTGPTRAQCAPLCCRAQVPRESRWSRTCHGPPAMTWSHAAPCYSRV